MDIGAWPVWPVSAQRSEGVYRIRPWLTQRLRSIPRPARVGRPPSFSSSSSSSSSRNRVSPVLSCLLLSHCRRRPASCTRMQPSCTPPAPPLPPPSPANAAASTLCMARAIHDQSVPVQRRRQQRGGAAPVSTCAAADPAADPAIITIRYTQLAIQCRAAAPDKPARAWPQGATWLGILACTSELPPPAYHGPVFPKPEDEWAHSMPPARPSESCQARRRFITIHQRARQRLVASRCLVISSLRLKERPPHVWHKLCDSDRHRHLIILHPSRPPSLFCSFRFNVPAYYSPVRPAQRSWSASLGQPRQPLHACKHLQPANTCSLANTRCRAIRRQHHDQGFARGFSQSWRRCHLLQGNRNRRPVPPCRTKKSSARIPGLAASSHLHLPPIRPPTAASAPVP